MGIFCAGQVLGVKMSLCGMTPMCDTGDKTGLTLNTIPVRQAVGTVLAHDITGIRPGEFKGRAFRKGHVIREEDVCHLQRLGKENLFVLKIADDEMHEDDAACMLANALMGNGVAVQGEPKEGKINLVAARDGLLKVNKNALHEFNLLGDVMCASLHDNTIVKTGRVIAGTRAIPLVVKREVVEGAVRIGENAGKILHVKEMRRPRVGVVITGNEIYYGRMRDAFAPIMEKKMAAFGGRIIGTYYAPDDEHFIEKKLRELLTAGADLLITTGGMSVDPDDVTRFAIRRLGAVSVSYGSAVLPGAMLLVAYIKRELNSNFPPGQGGRDADVSSEENPESVTQRSEPVPVLGIPACGMYAATTVFDLVLPRVLAGEIIGREELAEFGHGGLCLKCEVCHYPVCPFGKC